MHRPDPVGTPDTLPINRPKRRRCRRNPPRVPRHTVARDLYCEFQNPLIEVSSTDTDDRIEDYMVDKEEDYLDNFEDPLEDIGCFDPFPGYAREERKRLESEEAWFREEGHWEHQLTYFGPQEWEPAPPEGATADDIDCEEWEHDTLSRLRELDDQQSLRDHIGGTPVVITTSPSLATIPSTPSWAISATTERPAPGCLPPMPHSSQLLRGYFHAHRNEANSTLFQWSDHCTNITIKPR